MEIEELTLGLGIADLPACGENDFLCKRRNQFIVSRAYSEFAQTHSVNAQYFRVSGFIPSNIYDGILT